MIKGLALPKLDQHGPNYFKKVLQGDKVGDTDGTTPVVQNNKLR